LLRRAFTFSAARFCLFSRDAFPSFERVTALSVIEHVFSGRRLCFLFCPPASIQVLCYFIAAYALFLGIGKLRLAQHWDCGSRTRLVINVLGCMAVCFSGVLVAIANGDERNVIEVLGLYSLFLGAQMLLSTFYLYRQGASRTKSMMEQKQAHV